jgi:hypothetical protein
MRSLKKISLAFAATLVFAMPALPNEILISFGATPIGTYTTSGGGLAAGSVITNITGWTDYNSLFQSQPGSVSSAAGDIFSLTLIDASVSAGIATDTWALTQTVGTPLDGIALGATLLQFTGQSTLTVNASTQTVNFLSGYVGSNSGSNATFLTYEGIYAGTAQSVGSTALTLTGTGSSGQIASATITQNFASAPEPASFLLIGTGLISLAFVSRRRRSQA